MSTVHDEKMRAAEQAVGRFGRSVFLLLLNLVLIPSSVAWCAAMQGHTSPFVSIMPVVASCGLFAFTWAWSGIRQRSSFRAIEAIKKTLFVAALLTTSAHAATPPAVAIDSVDTIEINQVWHATDTDTELSWNLQHQYVVFWVRLDAKLCYPCDWRPANIGWPQPQGDGTWLLSWRDSYDGCMRVVVAKHLLLTQSDHDRELVARQAIRAKVPKLREP